jgi:hypothetical protein
MSSNAIADDRKIMLNKQAILREVPIFPMELYHMARAGLVTMRRIPGARPLYNVDDVRRVYEESTIPAIRKS